MDKKKDFALLNVRARHRSGPQGAEKILEPQPRASRLIALPGFDHHGEPANGPEKLKHLR